MAVLTSVAVAAVLGPPPGVAAAADLALSSPELDGPPPAASAFVPVAPCRLVDSRASQGYEAIDVDRIRVPITGRCDVPDEAVAVAVNVTVVGAEAPGFVTAWPAGGGLPEASTVNFGTGDVRANGVLVALGVNGSLDVRSSVPTQLLVDVTGWFSPTSWTQSGRFVPTAPRRIFDSRSTGAPLPAGGTTRVPLPAGVPTDALALAVNITTTGPNAPGYVTVHPAGSRRPEASVLNTERWDQTRAAATIAPVGPEGLDLYVSGGGHVIVDVTGWFTGPSARPSDEGLFVPVDPFRVLDTRTGDPLWPGGAAEIGVVAGASAMALNLAVSNSPEWNFVTAHPARGVVPVTSSVNVNGGGDAAANFALVPQSTEGVAVVAHRRADVLADIAGWFTGPALAASGPPPRNERPPVCATDASPASIAALFRSDALFHGADYQRVTPLPDGRTLWMFQDVHVPTRHGPRLLHNAGLLQSGNCFHLLHGGTFADPVALFMADRIVPFSRWYWPLGATVGSGGDVYLFMAEMYERGRGYLDRTEPTATWLLRLDAGTLELIDRRPAPDPSPRLYGWSIVDHGAYTYLYAQCHRQFGFEPLVFSDPLVYAHDFSCAGRVTVGRVPRGDLGTRPEYWTGSGWGGDASRAVPVIPQTDVRIVNPTQVHHDGTRFVAVTKEGDWWGDTIYVDVAPAAQGPWRTIATVPLTPRCSICNTYFASFVATPTPGRLLIGLSNNTFPAIDLTGYFPTLLELRL